MALPMLMAASGVASASERMEMLVLEEGRLVATLEDGGTREGQGLVGLELVLGETGQVLRIDSVGPDPHAQGPGIWLYDVAVRPQAGGTWERLCDVDPYGATTAIAVPGHWLADGGFVQATAGRFSFACTAGARGKCVRFGYPAWVTAPDGTSLALYHAACVRMARADYCGDGVPHTVAGMTIQIIDRTGVNPQPDTSDGAFEAVWGVGGALCLARAKRPEFPLGQILEQCPRLAEVPAERGDQAALDSLPGALLANRS